MSQGSAHDHPWKISDVVLFPALLLAIVLEFLVWPSHIPGIPYALLALPGALLVAVGPILIWRSKRELDRAGQPSLPGTPTTRLITSGPFRYSRNPNYLGAVMIALGSGLLVDSLWFLALALGSAAILELWMIRPEERYLRAKFDEEFDAYARRVRRWF